MDFKIIVKVYSKSEESFVTKTFRFLLRKIYNSYYGRIGFIDYKERIMKKFFIGIAVALVCYRGYDELLF